MTTPATTVSKPKVCQRCGHDVNRHWDAGVVGPPFPVACYAVGGGCGCMAALEKEEPPHVHT